MSEDNDLNIVDGVWQFLKCAPQPFNIDDLIFKNYKNEGEALIHFCIRKNKKDSASCLKFLLQAGSDPNLEDGKGGLPLCDAVAYERLADIDILLQNLDCGVNKKESNAEGMAPLHYTGVSGDEPPEYLKRLLQEENLDVNIQTSDYGDTLLHLLCETNNTELLEILVKDPRVDLHVPNGAGTTPLYCAETSDAKKILKQAIIDRNAPYYRISMNDFDI